MHNKTFLKKGENQLCSNCGHISANKADLSFASFLNILIVSLQRNSNNNKSQERVLLSYVLQLRQKSSKKLINYNLVSVILRVGEFTSFRNFSCFILKKDTIIELNDQTIKQKNISEEKNTFRRKWLDVFHPDCGLSSSDFDEHDYNNHPKTLLKDEEKFHAVMFLRQKQRLNVD